jgi:HAD superfamily hydrolase (TIGR01549 family)
MKKKLISFDLDQTLVETKKAHGLSFNLAFKEQGFNIPLKKIIPFIDGRHSHEVILSIKPNLKEEEIQKIRKRHYYFLNKTIKYAKPIPKILESLKELKKDYKLALVTNCEKIEANLLLKSSKIPKKIFDIIILANQVRYPKPWPDEIFKAERLAHVKSDIHVGDSIYDILAAKKAKAMSIAVLTGQTPKKLLEKYKPDYIIKSVAYLPILLKSLDF